MEGQGAPHGLPVQEPIQVGDERYVRGSLAMYVAGRLRGAYVRAVSGGKAARRAQDVILALVAPRASLDPALRPARQVILSWAKRVALELPLVEWIAQAWAREVDHPSPPVIR